MACTDQDFINSILRQFKGPCDDTLDTLVPALWELTAPESCGNTRLHFLTAKRETVLALMGCEAYSVDAYDFHRQLDGNIKGDSQSDIRTQTQTTRNSTRFSLGTGATRYDEHSNARSVGTMDRNDLAIEKGDGSSFYRDDGKGNGFNISQSSTSIEAFDTSQSLSSVVGRTDDIGNRRDCNYEVSMADNEGEAAGVPPFLIVGFTGNTSQWRKFTKTEASDKDASSRVTHQSGVRRVDDVRDGQGTHDWLSQFLANIFWVDTDFEIRTAHDRTDTRRHQEAHAKGDGDGFSEVKDEGHNAAQGTVKSESTSASTRTQHRVDSINAVKLANSQRFANLQRIYDQLTVQIEHEKRQTRMSVTGRVAVLPCKCNGSCVCGPSLRMCGYAALSCLKNGSNLSGIVW